MKLARRGGGWFLTASVMRHFPVDCKLFSKNLLPDRDNRTISPDEDLYAVNAVLGKTEVRIGLDSTAIMLLAGNEDTRASLDETRDV